jgi:hypothetical protein
VKTVLIFIYIQVLFISGFSDTLIGKSDITNRQCEYEQFICDDSIKYVFDEGILFGVFTKEDGPFLISNSITVPSGETLEFGPGCKIYIAGNNPSITVFGKIQIKGNAQSPVVFMSGKKNAAAGDWDRIYCRSNERSIFDYCIIRNSNYGIYVENGSAIIQNCIFEHNKVHALAVKNAETTVLHSKFSGGHNVAISLFPGALVEATNLILFENQTAIGSHDLSILRLDSGSISKNVNGIVTTQNASIKIIAASITRNKNGVLSTANIPRRMRDMIYGNGTDAEVISAAEMENILLKPEDFKTF